MAVCVPAPAVRGPVTVGRVCDVQCRYVGNHDQLCWRCVREGPRDISGDDRGDSRTVDRLSTLARSLRGVHETG